MHRLASLIVAVVVASFTVYAEPPADPGDDPPVLLKKKGAPEIQDPVPPPADDKDKDKKPDDAPKPNAGAAQPDKPQQDPDEVLNRAAKDMHRAEDHLANKEIDEGARQAQDDALKDLDQLIDLSENPPESKDDQNGGSSGASSKPAPSKSASSKPDPSGSSSKSGSSGTSGSSGRKSKAKGKGKGQGSGAQPGAGGSSGDQQPSGGKPDQQPGDPNNKSANGGNGGKDSPPLKDHNADLYKDVWGHLPETLRAEMNAYSGAKGFMPEYEALIRKYYSTIAEQGRRRGD